MLRKTFYFILLAYNLNAQDFSADSCYFFLESFQDSLLKEYLDSNEGKVSTADYPLYHYFYSLFHKYASNTEKHLFYLLKGEDYLQNSKVPDSIKGLYLYEFALMYQNNDQLGKALNYIDQAMSLNSSRKDSIELSRQYFVKGNIYFKKADFEKAREHYALSRTWNTNEKMEYTLKLNISAIDLATDNLEEVEQILLQVHNYEVNNSLLKQAAGTMNNLCNYYRKVNRYDKALSILDTLIDHAVEIGAKTNVISKIYKTRLDIHDDLEQYEEFVEWKIKQSTFLKENKVEEVDKILEKLALQNSLSEQKAKVYRNRLWISILGGTTGTLLLFLFGYNRYNKLKQSAIQQELETTKVQAALDAAKAKIEGEQKERSAIASVLHDKVASLLTAADVHLKVAGKKEGGNSLEKASEILRDVNMQVRDLSHQLVSPTLTRFGLEAALDSLVSKADSRELKITLDSNLGNSRFPENKEVFLYRSTTELLQNVMKHSNADYCEIKIQKTEGKLELSISDNGTQKQEIRMGHGLTHISNRVEAFRGKFEIVSNPGNLSFIIELPIPLQD